MPPAAPKKKQTRRRRPGNGEVVLIPFTAQELKNLVLERMGTAKNKGGRPPNPR